MKYTFNDGGRSGHFKGKTGDCVTRAIAIATKLPYIDVYNSLFDIAKNWKGNSVQARIIRRDASPRNGTSRKVWVRFLNDYLGLVEMREKRKLNDSLFYKGTYIVKVRKHTIAIIDGVVHDTWDSRKTSGAYTDGVPQWKTVTRYWKVK